MNISLLANKENLVLIDDCMEKAQRKLPEVLNAGKFIRKYHMGGQTNFSTRSSTINALGAGKIIINGIEQNKQKLRVKIIGQRIPDAINVVKTYFKNM